MKEFLFPPSLLRIYRQRSRALERVATNNNCVFFGRIPRRARVRSAVAGAAEESRSVIEIER